mmetsp:Transcript_24710/g.71335  ORF Transcript_24710/g.71335 Transcript_24710/m.71335 type:complete len:415 (+) Transcript_24710:33-1277(+)
MDDLLLHVFVIAPAIRWLISPQRPWDKRLGVIMAITALGAIAVYQCQREESNHYDVLGVSPFATKAEIQTAYRRLSLQYHPDKHSDPKDKDKAVKTFNKIRDAQEVLKDDKKRRTYGRFGDFNTEIDDRHFFDVVVVALLHGLISFLFGFLYTFSKETQVARQVFLSYLLVAFCLDLQLRFGGPKSDEFLWWIPAFGRYLVFEKIKVLQKLSPIVLNGSILIASAMHTDKESGLEFLGRTLLHTNLEIVNRMEATMERCGVAALQDNPHALNGQADTDNGSRPPAETDMPSATNGSPTEGLRDRRRGSQQHQQQQHTQEDTCPAPAAASASASEGRRERGRGGSDASHAMTAMLDTPPPGMGVSATELCQWSADQARDLQEFVKTRAEQSKRGGMWSIGTFIFLGILFFKLFLS